MVAVTATLLVNVIAGVQGHGASIASLTSRVAVLENSERLLALENRMEELKSEQMSATAVGNLINSQSAAIAQLERDVDAICERLSKTEALVSVSPTLAESLASLRERIAAQETRISNARNASE